MICFMCKGSVQEGFSTFTADIDGYIVVIKNVPSSICEQCGETFYSYKVAQRLEQIVDSLIGSASAEIAVVSYSEKADAKKILQEIADSGEIDLSPFYVQG